MIFRLFQVFVQCFGGYYRPYRDQGAGLVSTMAKSSFLYRITMIGLRILAVYLLLAWAKDRFGYDLIGYLLALISWLG